MVLIYFILAFAATTSGALAGLGGGIIIKPVLDVIGLDNLQTISILSSATVFSMALSSTIKQIIHGFRIEKRMLILAIGAAIGGITGGQFFILISDNMDELKLKGLHAVILMTLLIIVLFKNRLPDYEIKNLAASALTGFLLGLIAAFLGIGGGPINVVILCMFLAMNTKDAAVISILIILFSQGAKLTMLHFTTGFEIYDNLDKLFYMIPGGVIGGLLGANLNRKLSPEFIDRFFQIMIIAVIFLNLYNAVNAFFMH